MQWRAHQGCAEFDYKGPNATQNCITLSALLQRLQNAHALPGASECLAHPRRLPRTWAAPTTLASSAFDSVSRRRSQRMWVVNMPRAWQAFQRVPTLLTQCIIMMFCTALPTAQASAVGLKSNHVQVRARIRQLCRVRESADTDACCTCVSSVTGQQCSSDMPLLPLGLDRMDVSLRMPF